MENKRTNEIVNSFTSFTRDAYYKGEELPELLKLQEEVVRLTFNEEHAELGNLKIWDVERHLEKMNEACDGAATVELQKFEEECKDLCNMIKGIISGSKGETKAFRSLERVRCSNRVLKNVEITTDKVRTELDAVVVTKGGVFIVEVKNTGRDVFIDEEGNYYRTGEFLKWDSSIGTKMSAREELVQKILNEAGYKDVKVQGIIVFTDSRIEVRNRCDRLNTCFLSQLPYLIEEGQSKADLTEKDLEVISAAIESERCSEAYPIKFDAAQFKQDFATVMAILEEASATKDTALEAEVEPETEKVPQNPRSFWEVLNRVFTSPYARAAGTTAAAFAVSVISAAVSMRHTY